MMGGQSLDSVDVAQEMELKENPAYRPAAKWGIQSIAID